MVYIRNILSKLLYYIVSIFIFFLCNVYICLYSGIIFLEMLVGIGFVLCLYSVF